MSLFDLTHFYGFCNSLRIDTKERGQIFLGRHLMGSQRYAVNEMAKGLEQGVHEFVHLKARQLGISTIMLAFDLYWIAKFRGLTGALVVQDDPSREKFRSTLEMYWRGLPPSLKQRVHGRGFGNRNQVVFENRSRFEYRVAGTKQKQTGTLGRSSALAFLHATEAAFWGNPDDIAALQATLAQENPLRLYVFESTANGFNHYWDMWHSAKDSVTKRAIFIGWWTNEFYRAPEDSDVYKAYWGAAGKLTVAERTMLREVKQLYGFQISREQMAWYRWYLAEKCDENELMMWQEMPSTEYQAFVATGSQFFTSVAISRAYHSIQKQPEPMYARFDFGATFQDTQIRAANSRQAQLTVWEQPVAGGYYALGADPAYGSSDTADRYAISIWRCYADQAHQVAEFCTPDLTTGAFAWAMTYLAGWYEPCIWNLEVNGPGQAVLAELQSLGRQRMMGPATGRPLLDGALRNISTYLFMRHDSLYRVPTAIHSISNYQFKERYLGTYRDFFERDVIRVRSRALVDEMKSMKRKDGGTPEASGRQKDDRVISAGLAVIAWNDQLRSRLMMLNETMAIVQDRLTRQVGPTPNKASSMVAQMFERIGVLERPKAQLPGIGSGIARRG